MHRTIAALSLAVACAVAAPAAAATIHVAQQAPGASDQNPGTEQAPLLTIAAAMQRVNPGDTVLVGDGVYREEAVFPGEDWKDPTVRSTLAAAPGAEPVITGSEPVDGPWTRADVPLASPQAATPAIYWRPFDTYTMMVFVDGQPLKQIGLQGNVARAASNNGFQYQRQWDGKTVADMRPGSFLCDGDAKRLYVWLADGSDPAAHKVEASVRDRGVLLNGTWTLRGLTVEHVQDGFWPREQAVAVTGDGSSVEDCHIVHNDFLGLIVSGQDCVVRGNEIAHNGLEGVTTNYAYRMLFEGNELHHNAWRGDVVCLTAGNKFVMTRDCRFVRNWWHDEPATALWLDISNTNALIAENRFDDCAVGVYWEISRWAVIANNVLRRCGRGIWSYGADALIAHNVLDRCGEGIVVTGSPRTAVWAQSTAEDVRPDPLMGTHNNLIVDNLLIDSAGAFIGITQGQPHGWGNWSDWNAFVWTLPSYHPTGVHLNFMDGWDDLYGKLPIWRMERRNDTHSVVVDPLLLGSIRRGNPYVGLAEREVFSDAMFVDREAGDYRLKPESPLRGKGIGLPAELDSHYESKPGNQIGTRCFAKTRLADAPDPTEAVPVFGTATDGHYRLQPLPKLHPLVELDASLPGTPGLNEEWSATGNYPRFTTAGEADSAADNDWVLLPTNGVADPGFDKPLAAAEQLGAWSGSGGTHTYIGTACANLLPAQRTNALLWQPVGTLRADCEYLLVADMLVSSVSPDYAGAVEMYLAVGDPTTPLAGTLALRAEPSKTREWSTRYLHLRTDAADARVGQKLYVVLAARVDGPADNPSADPVALARWYDVWLLSSP